MSSSPTSPGTEAPVKEGDILAAKYRVEKVLGVGGMGVVVAAEHIELSQKVALKFLLKQAASNEDLVGRFLREARASVRLKGTHVAKTLDVGRLEDGCPYIVMEYLEGHDLHSEIRSKTEPLPIEVACSYIVQASEGLAEAHSLGIVHRDLKPGNLFLTKGVGGRPLVKVLDFGISKTMDTSIGGDGLSLTKTEMLLGSPLYMSPEQMRSSKHVDERSDLWALGAIAFELLTSRVPFEAESILELCFKVAQEKAPNPQTLRPELPDALAAAVMRCLEKDPADRFANVGELAQAFEQFALQRDRGAAERAMEVLATGKRPVQRSVHAPAVSPANAVTVGLPGPRGAAERPPTELATGSGPQEPAEPPSAKGVPAPTPSQVEQVAPAAWGTTQAQPAPGKAAKSKKGLVVLAAAVVAVAALGGVVVSRKGSGEGTQGGVASAAALPGAGMVATPAANAANPSTSASTSATTTTATATANVEADAGTTATPSTATPATATPATVALATAAVATTKPSSRPVVAKPAKPTATATTTPITAPTAEPGGFIKVRE